MVRIANDVNIGRYCSVAIFLKSTDQGLSVGRILKCDWMRMAAWIVGLEFCKLVELELVDREYVRLRFAKGTVWSVLQPSILYIESKVGLTGLAVEVISLIRSRV